MAKARAILKRRKAVRNIRKITKTMQMIATVKFQRSMKRDVGTKPYTLKVRQLVQELAASVGDIPHPLLRRVTEEDRTNRLALIVITSNRGLAGAYNGSILRTAARFIREQEAAGKQVDLCVSGKKGISHFNFKKRHITQRYDRFADDPSYADVEKVASCFLDQFVNKQIDAVHVAYMDFISTSTQKPAVLTLLPLAGIHEVAEHLARNVAERESQARAGTMNADHSGENVRVEAAIAGEVTYDFSPGPRELLDYLLPLAVKTALFQCFLDAVTSESVARMVAMKSATDNADKMIKSLTMRYNRARQSQITTELSEIMGGVEAMKVR